MMMANRSAVFSVVKVRFFSVLLLCLRSTLTFFLYGATFQ